MRNLTGNTQGFTLIEAMITIGLLAISLSLALPSYSNYVDRANRTEAMQALMEAAACQERIHSRTNAYSANACGGNTTNNHYSISVTTSNSNQNFVASANPLGSRVGDHCGTYGVTHTGARTADGQSGEFAAKCWKGK